MRKKDKHVFKEISPENQHKCPICSDGFPLRIDLREHLIACKAEMARTIPAGPTTPPKPKPKVARLTKPIEETHQCRICPLSSKTGISLIKHERSHVEEKPIQNKFPMCDHSYARKNALTMPKKTNPIHTKEKPFVCNLCGKSFSQHLYLKFHFLAHLPKSEKLIGQSHYSPKDATSKSVKEKRLFFCQICPASFSLKVSLRRHNAGHSQTRPYNCKECTYSASTKFGLTIHMRLHGGTKFKKPSKRLKCKFCGRLFNIRNNLHRHLLEHKQAGVNKLTTGKDRRTLGYNSPKIAIIQTSEDFVGKNLYTCYTCGCSFTNASILNRHVRRTGHPATDNKIKKLKCKECEYTFLSDKDLCLHYSECHKLPAIFLQNLMLRVGDIVVLDE